MCDRSRGLADLSSGGNDSSANAALAGPDDLELLWSPIFFTLHHIAFALAIILTLLAVIVGFIWVQWRENRPAAVLFIPYAAWVAFASLLNYSLYRLN
jgi:tryptophan-rich sensory protein